MKQPDIGFVRVQVGDLSLLSQAYRELQGAIDRQERWVSEAGMQRLRQIVSEVENLSDHAAKPIPIVSGVWAGRTA